VRLRGARAGAAHAIASGAPTLGWEAFAAQVEPLELPVFALGGLGPRDLETARVHGAHGIAMQRAAWQPAPGDALMIADGRIG
jgi:thiamine monophosphate synthase